jgi:hypothetical protein
MKLWEYVLKYDKDADFIKWLCEREDMNEELFIKRDYCPPRFECFTNTEFENLLYPLKKKGDCKYHESYPFNLNEKYHGGIEKMRKSFIKQCGKCYECWNREIVDKDEMNKNEYEMYLKLKEKFERVNI